MGEMEGLGTHEPLARRLERHAFDRLIMLSDGVFAIAITLAALEIRPQGEWSDLSSLWGALRLSLFAYMVSFAVIAAYWAAHRDVFARLEKVDAPMTLLTLALLFSVAVLPTTTRLLYERGATPAFQLYAMSVCLTGVVQSAIWVYASLRPGVMKPEVTRGYRAGHIAMSMFVPSCFLALAIQSGRGFTPAQVWATVGVVALVALGRRSVLPWLERRWR